MNNDSPLRRRWTNAEIVVFPTAILAEPLSPTALRLWIALAQFANDDRQCWPSRRRLLELMPPTTAKGTLRRARAELEQAGLLEVEYRKDSRNGRDTTPMYTLMVPVHEGDETVPPVGDETVPPEGDETVLPLNLISESQQKEVPDVEVVFTTWVKATGKHPTRTRLDDKRKRLIERALKSHPVEDVLDAVTGWQHDPFYCGQNDQRRAYNDLSLLLRDAERIERFRDMAREFVPAPMPENTSERKDENGVVTHRHMPGSGWVPIQYGDG